MSSTSNKIIVSPERGYWMLAARALKDGPGDHVDIGGSTFTTRPYLLAHPEREIAAAGTHIGVAYCAACDITYKAPPVSVYEGPGIRMHAAYRFVNEHNALIHPRRAARLTK